MKKLKDWSLRTDKKNHVTELIARASPRLLGIREGLVIPFNLPAIPELGVAQGFDFYLR